VDEPADAPSALARARREIAELRGELAALSRDREEWLTVLAHELRTPLTVIGGYNRLLLSGEAGPLSAEQARYLGESTRCCQRLDAFVVRLLDTVHDGFLEQRLEITRNDLGRVLADACTAARPLVEAKGLRSTLTVDDDARFALVDPERIDQVVTNLISNAVRHTRSGGEIRVTARRLPGAGREHIEVAVADEGPGIDPADRERVFEPFVRLDGAERKDGLGLGLSICRRIVTAHGGTIAVDTGPGGGCRFAFTLAAAEAAEPAEAS
jgi:signal transduction histidine kinase